MFHHVLTISKEKTNIIPTTTKLHNKMKFSSIIYLSSATLLASSSSAFTVIPGAPRTSALSSTITEADQFYFVDDAPANADVPSSLLVSEPEVEKPKPTQDRDLQTRPEQS